MAEAGEVASAEFRASPMRLSENESRNENEAGSRSQIKMAAPKARKQRMTRTSRRTDLSSLVDQMEERRLILMSRFSRFEERMLSV